MAQDESVREEFATATTDAVVFGATEPPPAPAIPEPVPHPRHSDLVQVAKFIEQSQFAVVGEKVSPFTRQIKDEARRFFPDDQATYEKADKMQQDTIRLVTRMRIATLVTFIVFSGLVYGRVAVVPNDLAQWAWWWPSIQANRFLETYVSLSPHLLTVMDVAALALAFFGVREIIRVAILDMIVAKDVKAARGELKAEHTRLIHECQKVAADLSLIEKADVWPDRAGKSAMVALWYALRADYVDRYSTTSLWKISESFEWMEVIFWSLKGLVAIAAVTLAAAVVLDHQERDWLALTPLIAYLLLAYLFWIRFGHRSNEFLNLIFNAGAEGSARTHYFDAFATQVRNLARLSVQNMRAQ